MESNSKGFCVLGGSLAKKLVQDSVSSFRLGKGHLLWFVWEHRGSPVDYVLMSITKEPHLQCRELEGLKA